MLNLATGYTEKVQRLCDNWFKQNKTDDYYSNILVA